MFQTSVLAVAFFIFGFVGQLQAATLPSFMRDGSSRFLARSLGSACFTMDSVQRTLPCNPAAIAKERGGRFDGNVFFGTNVDYLDDANRILDGTSSEEEVGDIFSRRESSQGEASIELSYQTSKWGLAVEPYRLLFYSKFENPAMPVIDLTVAEEQSIRGQIASYTYDNFYAGLQVRYSHVRYVSKYFFLSELITNQDPRFFAPETQELLYVEPGVMFAWEELPWQPQVSAGLMNWGFTDHKSDTYPVHPEGQLGASVKPEIPLGLLEVGAQFTIKSETESLRDALRVAVAYQLGILQAVFSASDLDQSAGFLLNLQELSGGLSYWRETDNQGIFIQLGVSL